MAVAEVKDIEANGDVKGDLGGDDSFVAEHFADSGEDSPPLPGDFMALDEGTGSGTKQVTGYHDPVDGNREAQPGEKRTYSRNTGGVKVAEVYLKGDGTVVIKSLLAPTGGTFEIDPATGAITINGKAVIDALGEVTAKSDVAGGVSLSGHMTPSPFGPLGPPIPGT